MNIVNFDVDPCDERIIRGFLVRVYEAKKIRKDWESAKLRDAVFSERKTYLRYGDVSLTDVYDNNAAVYLVCSTRITNGVGNEERFSIRFVPGQDMSLETIGNFLSHKLSGISFFAKIGKRFALASRACGGVNNCNSLVSGVNQKMVLVPYAFALSIEHFLNCTNEGVEADFLLATIRNEVYKHSLSAFVHGRRVPRFFCISELPEWDQGEVVSLDRAIEAFRYPRYFFEHNQLRNLFKVLIEAGKLSVGTVAQYVGGKHVVNEILSEVRLNGDWTKNLGALLVLDGSIPDSSISGEELRDLINKHVSDGPKLRILCRSTWERDFSDLMLK